ncbi:hypothetical protein HDC93_001548 [Streptomyces sp. AK010]|nr:hypothetical protein [Streptomyces sp. AK010]
MQHLGRPEELLDFGAGDGEVRREPLALDDDAPPVGRARGDVDAPVPSAALHDDVGAAVAAQQLGDVFFELAPVHGVHGGHDSGEGAVLPGAFQSL